MRDTLRSTRSPACVDKLPRGGWAVSEQPLVVGRARQLFGFLKAFAEQRIPAVRHIDQHAWKLWLHELPVHPDIEVGRVRMAGEPTPGNGEDGEAESRPLLRVRRPVLTPPPPPPPVVREFLPSGWDDPAREVVFIPSRNTMVEGQAVPVRWEDDPSRVASGTAWLELRAVWAEAERPSRSVMQIYQRLFDLRQEIALRSEQVELVLGDGRLRWRRPDGETDHPVLLQRVELTFDADQNEFAVVDADRAPELHGTVLIAADGTVPAQFHEIRTRLEAEGFHPLADEGTTGFLKGLHSNLSAGATWHGGHPPVPPPEGDEPVMGRNPLLFLRNRVPGFAAAFDRVLKDLEHRASVPLAIARAVGVEQPLPDHGTREGTGAWSEPPDVLLSKPANDQQIEIARVLEQKGTVLVQGPPGTGKSHTIANLIGHLVAQGKRVLVTSHTTKALHVLRSQVVEDLRALCVPVLETDSEGRTQLQESVGGILTRLSRIDDRALEREAGELAERRGALIAEIAGLVRDLERIRKGEYEPIVVGGDPVEPAEAATWVRANAGDHGWIPPGIQPGAPLPLSREEVEELYGSNGVVSVDEERELAGGLPDVESLLTPDEYEQVLAESAELATDVHAGAWLDPAREEDLPLLEVLAEDLRNLLNRLAAVEPWQRSLVKVGHAGGGESGSWRKLAGMVAEARAFHEETRELLLEYAVGSLPAGDPETLRATVHEIITHLERNGGLGWFTLLFRPRWKPLVRETRVNGRPPGNRQAFQAVTTALDLRIRRATLRTRWLRLAEPEGLPEFSHMADPPEHSLTFLADQFDGLLDLWNERWPSLRAQSEALGLAWDPMRDALVAAEPHRDPFERDCDFLASVSETVAARWSTARTVRARRLLAENHAILGQFRGPVVEALDRANTAGDSPGYRNAWHDLRDLLQKATAVGRRYELLTALGQSAAGWARAISTRSGVHGTPALPGNPVLAWRWIQWKDELDQRRGRDEAALQRKLEERHSRLRKTTTALIDRRAWRAQHRRVDLAAQQALHGWAQTHKRIGRGTGKRAPELLAQARAQLARAQEAVPVWIMPLTRVAEAVDPLRNRFDVVIIDEASQCDVTGLLAWYLADSVLVVGDDRQVSPLAVGQKMDVVQQLIREHLRDVPNRELYDGRLSLYDLAQQCFGGTIRLREHFRCMPDIIEFSNELSYDFEIEPLRDPFAVPPPHVVEERVGDGIRVGRTNAGEARRIAALIAAMDERPEYEGYTFGAISLLADEQAHLIWHLAAAAIGDPARLERRHFLAGNPAQFQGDERDVILLSMVDSPGDKGPQRMRQEDLLKQRYNVAASRARNQLWVVHSLDPARDLKPGDLRRRLLEYVRAPGARGRAAERAARRAESPFEVEVIRRLVAAGYEVLPQVKVGGYRIDLVVRGGGKQVALECDGARFHPPEQIPADLRRQAILERCGWTFLRIRSTVYYDDPDGTMRRVGEELGRLGVTPDAVVEETAAPGPGDHPVIQAVRARAWEIMRERGWVDPADEDNGVQEAAEAVP